MKLFSRLYNLVTGFLSRILSGAERNNPEIAYENAVNNLTSKYVALKKAASSIIRRRENIDMRLSKEREQLLLVARDLEHAVVQESDDVAIILIQKKEMLEGEIKELEVDLVEAQNDAEEIKGSLTMVKSEIVRLKDERDRVIAKMNSAKAKIAIQEQLEGITVDAELKVLAEVRENVQNLITESKLNEELQAGSIDTQLKAIRERGSRESAVAKLRELKAQKVLALPAGKEVIKVLGTDAEFEEIPAKVVIENKA